MRRLIDFYRLQIHVMRTWRPSTGSRLRRFLATMIVSVLSFGIAVLPDARSGPDGGRGDLQHRPPGRHRPGHPQCRHSPGPHRGLRRGVGDRGHDRDPRLPGRVVPDPAALRRHPRGLRLVRGPGRVLDLRHGDDGLRRHLLDQQRRLLLRHPGPAAVGSRTGRPSHRCPGPGRRADRRSGAPDPDPPDPGRSRAAPLGLGALRTLQPRWLGGAPATHHAGEPGRAPPWQQRRHPRLPLV